MTRNRTPEAQRALVQELRGKAAAISRKHNPGRPVDPCELRLSAIREGERFLRAIDDLNVVKRFPEHNRVVRQIGQVLVALRQIGQRID